ncbi:MAG: adenosylhomocysteinase [Candidatus Bipolaricaulota bacterium]
MNTQGKQKIAWAQAHMPLQAMLGERFAERKPLVGQRMGVALHLEAKTAVFILTLRSGGAEILTVGSNPWSTQDDVVEALSEVEGIQVYARRGESEEERQANLGRLLDFQPTMVVEDGGDVAGGMAERGREVTPGLIGICEETTTGVERLRELHGEGQLGVPAIAVNDARMKYLVDNRHGTGQSSWEAIMRATNLLIAGKNVLIVGFGWCGRGLALRAAGLGARVMVAETDPVKAVEAAFEGYQVVRLPEGMALADVVITATGRAGVIGLEVLEQAKDGVLLANAGHFGYEIDIGGLESLARTVKEVRPNVHAYHLPDGRKLYAVGRGELVNLSAGDGHPVEIMDISFALQALAVEYVVSRGGELPAGVHSYPRELDSAVAEMVLHTLGEAGKG